MRELSDEEKEFIKSTIKENDIVEKNNEKKKRTKNRKKTIFKNIYFWIGIIYILALLLCGLVMLSMIRLQIFFGSDVMQEMAKQQITPDIKNKMNSAGMSWIPQAINLYKHQGMIIAGILTAATLLSLIIYIINLLVSNRKTKKECTNE